MKESETASFQLIGVPQKQEATNHNIYAEAMVQTNAGSVIAASVSIKPDVLCFVDFVGVPDPSDAYNSFFPCVLSEGT